MTMPVDHSQQQQLRYTAYLVRLWQDSAQGPWRASAQSVQSGQITRFGSLAELFAFLATASTGAAQVNAPPTAADAD